LRAGRLPKRAQCVGVCGQAAKSQSRTEARAGREPRGRDTGAPGLSAWQAVAGSVSSTFS